MHMKYAQEIMDDDICLLDFRLNDFTLDGARIPICLKERPQYTLMDAFFVKYHRAFLHYSTGESYSIESCMFLLPVCKSQACYL